MSSSKEAILMAKMDKKKPVTMDSVPTTEAVTVDTETSPKSGPGSIKEMRVTGGNTSLDILKATKAGSIGSANRMGFNPLEGSAAPTGASAVPKTKKSYSPITDYMTKRK